MYSLPEFPSLLLSLHLHIDLRIDNTVLPTDALSFSGHKFHSILSLLHFQDDRIPSVRSSHIFLDDLVQEVVLKTPRSLESFFHFYLTLHIEDMDGFPGKNFPVDPAPAYSPH